MPRSVRTFVSDDWKRFGKFSRVGSKPRCRHRFFLPTFFCRSARARQPTASQRAASSVSKFHSSDDAGGFSFPNFTGRRATTGAGSPWLWLWRASRRARWRASRRRSSQYSCARVWCCPGSSRSRCVAFATTRARSSPPRKRASPRRRESNELLRSRLTRPLCGGWTPFRDLSSDCLSPRPRLS